MFLLIIIIIRYVFGFIIVCYVGWYFWEIWFLLRGCGVGEEGDMRDRGDRVEILRGGEL